MPVWSTFWVLFVPAHPALSDVSPALTSLWTVCQVTALHLDGPICSQWCNSLKFQNLVGTTKLKVGVFLFWFYTHCNGQNVQYILWSGFAGNIQGWGKCRVGFEQSKFVSHCPHNINLGYFHNWLLPLYVWVWSGHISKRSVSAGWILWSAVQHNKEIVTSHSFSLQRPAQINTSPPLQGEEDNSTAANPGYFSTQ